MQPGRVRRRLRPAVNRGLLVPPPLGALSDKVDPDERTAAAGIANVARRAASGAAVGLRALGLPFYLAGTLNIVYDGRICAGFRDVRPPEEGRPPTRPGSLPER